ncbi:hypothetical protein [Eubacterium oxidoreducens]|uniref:Ig-like domain (Group 3) n=1 Tax=Eubacterium oxidoreducens TaxID=1732 RepID=A0A1G6B4E0_EUBOX|nr:hypothetical protein [Eubacterium oxidoreducens]SDB15293.1 hypothetical protein SAMN02910417_01135 [Eubacterium oxidoreducens]
MKKKLIALMLTCVMTVMPMSAFANITMEKTGEAVDAKLSETSYTYDEDSHIPEVYFSYYGLSLIEKTHYTIYGVYSDANCTTKVKKPKEVGTYYLKCYAVSGSGFVGSETLPYQITGVSAKKLKITLKTTSYDYDGKAKEPSVTVKYANGTSVDKDDYTVTYSNNKNAGTAKVTIAGTGNITGSVTKTFKIKKVASSTSVKNESKTYSYSKTSARSFKIGASNTSGGKITYSITKYPSGGKKYIKVSSKGVVTLKKKAPKGTYKIKVTSKATTNYKKSSATVVVTVK